MNLQLVVIAFVAFGAAAASGQVTTSDTAYQHEMQAYREGHSAEAEIFFRDALDQAKEFGELDPRFEIALKSLAVLLESERKYTEAASFYSSTTWVRFGKGKAITRRPNHSISGP